MRGGSTVIHSQLQQGRLSEFSLFQIKFSLLSIIGPRHRQLDTAEGDEAFSSFLFFLRDMEDFDDTRNILAGFSSKLGIILSMM